ncbi:phosphate regulon sensor histidine kinase PhoR [Rhizobium sp. KVB221]|uniref:histidine kinase n=1 Tax=Rhizobium setariae TaxID=2801340 RepID=A0A936YMK3_9HYPH|nr:phosphate regulon sensor histidine kinase PhoR [Rhizobium setariae]MBL0371492.1 phosphate regulon sensor histidine kinase PhoR [Rhizobium setariae]
MLQAFFGWLSKYKFNLAAAVAGFAALIAAGTNSWIAALVMLAAILPSVLVRSRPQKAETSFADTPHSAEKVQLAEVKSAFAGFDSPALLLDIEGNVLYQNPAAQHVFGVIDPGQHLSARIRSPVVTEMIRDVMANQRNGLVEYSTTLPTESVYQVRCIKADGASGVADFYVLIFRDISEARRIDRMRTDFVANASHELRTPLASLRGFIETLQGPARNDPDAHVKFLGIMLDQVTRMSRLVDDLMSLSRLELKASLAPGDAVDLVPLIGSVCDALAPLADKLGVEIRRELPAQPIIVGGDRDELTQVFENLIENGCKYGQEGHLVEVALTKEEDGTVQVSVTDHGPGIPEDHVPRLTERFYRVNVESSVSKKGTGLGLAIVKHILTRHRARLNIRSEMGKGSTFTVRF